MLTTRKSRANRMATRRHRNSDKANEWARKRAEAMALAKKRREERKRGQVSEEHTFKPQQISKPPSREGGNNYQNHGHPGVYDRNGRDVYYDRQSKSYPMPQNIQAQNGIYNNNFAPPQQQQHFQQPQSNLQQQQLQQQQNQLLQNSLPQAILPTQPVPLQQAMNGLPISSVSVCN